LVEGRVVLHRLMLLLCLCCAGSGSALRQAEAADDLARSLAESGSVDGIEDADGGVGDDDGSAILENASGRLASSLAIPFDADDTTRASNVAALFFLRSGVRRLVGATLSYPSRLRLAWLQRFLF
jgi:hypothetical protein